MNDFSNASFPFAAWTWHDGNGGILSTQICSDGEIRQERKHAKDEQIAPQKLGAIPSAQAAALVARCREALCTQAASQAAPDGETHEGESYELVIAENENQKSSRQVARANLNCDTALLAIRREVLGARRQVVRRWNFWSSAGARWFYLMTAITLALGIYIARDMKHDGQLQARAQRASATVIERGGQPRKTEYLTVRLDGASTQTTRASPEVKISKYLSHPNWEAATPGSKVDVLYDAQSHQAWLAADLLRWQKDKKTIWIIPGFLLLSAFGGWAYLRRFQIGVYGDGNEYMIHEDRVVTDDKDLAVSRSTLLWFKMFV